MPGVFLLAGLASASGLSSAFGVPGPGAAQASVGGRKLPNASATSTMLAHHTRTALGKLSIGI